MIDVGTGTGAVALLIARNRPDATVIATDTQSEAIDCARENAERLGISNTRFVEGSLLPDATEGSVHAVVANLPYVPDAKKESAGPWLETTYVGEGKDGLNLLRELAADARAILSNGGILILQMSGYQWTALGPELRALGYEVQEASRSERVGPVIRYAFWHG